MHQAREPREQLRSYRDHRDCMKAHCTWTRPQPAAERVPFPTSISRKR